MDPGDERARAPGCPPSCHSLSVSLTVTPLSIVSPDVEADVPAPGHDGSIFLTHPSSARGREMTQTSIDGHQLARWPGSAPKSMSGAWPGSQAGLCPSCATAWLNDWARRYVSKLGWALVCTSVKWGGTVPSPCKWLKERRATTVRALCWAKGPSVLLSHYWNGAQVPPAPQSASAQCQLYLREGDQTIKFRLGYLSFFL